MQNVKYKNWAILLRFVLWVGIIWTSLFFSFFIFTGIYASTDSKPYEKWEWISGLMHGYPVQAKVSISIPDSLLHADPRFKGDALNGILGSTVTVHLKSESVFKKWLWFGSYLTYGVLFVILSYLIIQLINAYLGSRFFEPKTFRKIRWRGFVIMWVDLSDMLFRFINLSQMPRFSYNYGPESDENVIGILVRPEFKMSLSYIGIGILIIILSDVIRHAINNKKDLEFTV